jgi:hypothetical protein
MNADQQHAKNAPLTALAHCGIDTDTADQYVADAIPSVHSETVARWITLAYQAGQGALAADVRALKLRVTAIEAAGADHAPPMAVDFDALRPIAERRTNS